MLARLRLLTLGLFMILTGLAAQQGVFAEGTDSSYGCVPSGNSQGGSVECQNDGPYDCQQIDSTGTCPALCYQFFGGSGILYMSTCSESYFMCVCWPMG